MQIAAPVQAAARPVPPMAHAERPLPPLPARPTKEQVHAHWLGIAARRAGVDLATWDPALGAAHNRDTVWRAYRYYADTFLAHPEFQWMGMAYAVAPTFGAAFEDLTIINRHLGTYGAWLDHLPGPIRDALKGALDLAKVPVRQIRHLETKLLSMQQQIFFDQSTMHEAFLAGGMAAIRQMHDVGLIDDRAVSAWVSIDEGRRSGRGDLLRAGTRELVWREQMQTITDDYDEIRQWGALSPALTYVMTSIGRPAIPGSRTPAQAVPIRVGGIRLPLPAMDVSRAADRWKLIEGDTLAAFDRLITEAPEQLRQLMRTDFDDRIRLGKFRRLPDGASALDVALLLGGIRSQHGRQPQPALVPDRR